MSDKPKEESVKSKFKTVIFLTLWCYLNHFYLNDLLNFSLKDWPIPLMILVMGPLMAVLLGPYVWGTWAYVELGEKIADNNSLSNTLTRISPLIFSYFLVSFVIWFPADGKLVPSLYYVLENPDWVRIIFWTVVIYYVVNIVAERPYDKVCFAVISILAIQNLLKFYSLYRLDDGCRTDFDGYTDCDDHYVQIIDRIADEAEKNELSISSFMAADLFLICIYCLALFVAFAFIKRKREKFNNR